MDRDRIPRFLQISYVSDPFWKAQWVPSEVMNNGELIRNTKIINHAEYNIFGN